MYQKNEKCTDEFFVEGIKTNHSLHLALMNDQTFQDNKHNINYLENNFMKQFEMTEAYNPKVVEKAPNLFGMKKIVLQQKKVKT